MIKRATSGQIESYTHGRDDGAIICKACSRIIVSKENLEHGRTCPYCHNNVDTVLSEKPLVEDNSEVIARPC
jgi:uncharacterized CHY-type Zn-finger protein